jgi:hypothetical protein
LSVRPRIKASGATSMMFFPRNKNQIICDMNNFPSNFIKISCWKIFIFLILTVDMSERSRYRDRREDFSNPFYVSTFLLIETETWYRIKGIIVRLCFTHSIKFSNMAMVCDLTYRILNCIWRYLICERKRALYSIKCVLRIFWQTWLHILI